MLKISSTIVSQIIWYNKDILFDKTSFNQTNQADKGINQAGQLFDTNGALRSWSEFKRELSLIKRVYSVGFN